MRKTRTGRSARKPLHSRDDRALSQEIYASFGYTFEQLDATLRARDPMRAPLTPKIIAAHPSAAHPLLRVHTESSRESLCISPEVMSHIVGMDREASLAFARLLAQHAPADCFVYRQRWRRGDLVT